MSVIRSPGLSVARARIDPLLSRLSLTRPSFA